MPPRIQRLLVILLMVYFTLIGGTFYTERTATLRIFHQVFTLALLAVWLVHSWQRGRGFPNTPLNRPLLLYGLLWFGAACLALDPRVSLEYTWPILTQILGFFLLVDLMQRGRQRWIMEGLFMVGALAIVLSGIEFAAWYLGLPLSPDFTQSWPQIHGWTLPPALHKVGLALNVSTMLGNFLATLIPITAVWAMTARQRDLRAGLWLLVGGLAVNLVLTGSRGAMLGLAASTGMLILTWLLKPQVRERFPRLLQPVLKPRVLLPLAMLALAVFVAGALVLTLGGDLRGGDVNRLDLWLSAMEMFYDDPLTGVGPRQYGLALRTYGEPILASQQDRLITAHNLPLHLLAEGGILTFAAGVWVVVTFGRAGWQRWRAGSPAFRRRLEGGLAAGVGFAVHNLVDTFTLTPLILPLLVMAAYTLAGHTTRGEALARAASPPQNRRVIPALLGGLLLIQIAFLPVHAGDLAHRRALRALAQDDLPGALAALQAAHAADPALRLYPLQTADVLGRMAARDPDAFLEAAIAAYEEGQALDPTWDVGWHNLAALYAQAGRLAEALRTQQIAVTWNPEPAGHHLKQGEYAEALGDPDAARAAYVLALGRWPELGASDFWDAPESAFRAEALATALARYSDQPELALRLANATGDLDAATTFAAQIDPETARPQALLALGDWAATVADETIAPCPACYYQRLLDRPPHDTARGYSRLAELALDDPAVAEQVGMTVEQMARTALFLSPNFTRRAWAVLARLAEEAGAEEAEVNRLLVRAVPLIVSRQEYALAVYGRVAALDYLPQARFPTVARPDYAPALWLAARLTASGDYDTARRVYEVILTGAPYDRQAQEELAALPE
ncbi:MAG: hypothetical protein Kow0077_13680 [Anaerolineae bacterium]